MKNPGSFDRFMVQLLPGFDNPESAKEAYHRANTKEVRQYCSLWVDFLLYERVIGANPVEVGDIYTQCIKEGYLAHILFLKMNYGRRNRLNRSEKKTNVIELSKHGTSNNGIGDFKVSLPNIDMADSLGQKVN